VQDAFELLETLRWTKEEGCFLLDRHLQRMEAAARRLAYPWNRERVVAALDEAVAGGDGPRRLRVLVDRDGRPRFEVAALDPMVTPVRAALAVHPIDPANPFLLHKTTNRVHLERERRPDYDDTVLWNPRREITESIVANIVVPLDGRKVTPAVECGLLPGTFRAELLARQEIVEGRISVDELRRVGRFWLINSVRGWYEAMLVG